ncbi:predicted protein [Chaetoceros tenuissimus]|uniref:J domain-containing protein n=1 Tax=Chaetoceros tenuissimus TaxID=426638 RepID=A0AAD3CRY5_9STRA|nr:predicted protein [Chaetoceros tenuissimus]
MKLLALGALNVFLLSASEAFVTPPHLSRPPTKAILDSYVGSSSSSMPLFQTATDNWTDTSQRPNRANNRNMKKTMAACQVLNFKPKMHLQTAGMKSGVVLDLDMKLVKRAYRAMALQHHPDYKLPKDATEEERQAANDHFATINQAYRFLTGTKRDHYHDSTSCDFNVDVVKHTQVKNGNVSAASGDNHVYTDEPVMPFTTKEPEKHEIHDLRMEQDAKVEQDFEQEEKVVDPKQVINAQFSLGDNPFSELRDADRSKRVNPGERVQNKSDDSWKSEQFQNQSDSWQVAGSEKVIAKNAAFVRDVEGSQKVKEVGHNTFVPPPLAEKMDSMDSFIPPPLAEKMDSMDSFIPPPLAEKMDSMDSFIPPPLAAEMELKSEEASLEEEIEAKLGSFRVIDYSESQEVANDEIEVENDSISMHVEETMEVAVENVEEESPIDIQIDAMSEMSSPDDDNDESEDVETTMLDLEQEVTIVSDVATLNDNIIHSVTSETKPESPLTEAKEEEDIEVDSIEAMNEIAQEQKVEAKPLPRKKLPKRVPYYADQVREKPIEGDWVMAYTTNIAIPSYFAYSSSEGTSVTSMKEAWRILGLEEHTFFLPTIKEAYRKMTKRYHPDLLLTPESTDEERQLVMYKAMKINDAYKLLKVKSKNIRERIRQRTKAFSEYTTDFDQRVGMTTHAIYENKEL